MRGHEVLGASTSDGNTYAVIDVEISSADQPFHTGRSRVMDTAGRVGRFQRRYGSRHG